MDNSQPKTGASIALEDVNGWLEYQLGQWNAWAEGRGDNWLALETNNPDFPTAGVMLMHAFTPLHRYADRILGRNPIDPPDPDAELTWPFISDWAARCILRHREAVEQLDPADGGKLVQFSIQSMGPVQVRTTRCLAHAASHAVWHLGGIIHLLRKAGIAPPSRSDFLYWGVDQEEPVGG